ncbi:MAG TPA: isoleucine--tRNA ligase [Polyangiaceae bacterium]|nr:isoleucine--tRNA ligase [Polyangiaceae bacterium]
MAGPVFSKVASELDFPKEEQEILRFWKERRIFEKTLERPAPKGPFVFYEGPPTANGLPHNGSVLTRVIKDLFPRYKTMRGYSVPRKAGWDTHGLPVEVEVEKELRIHGKAAIEQYGVEPFVKKCIESVFRYTKEWEWLTERVGFWVDLRDAYVTYHRSYVESEWWALSELFKKGLLYQGHKIVWWWAQGGTALSAGEVGQGYRAVDDPSVYVAFPLRTNDPALQDASLLVWTTTPWTLPSNMYAAVHPDFDYVVAKGRDGTNGRRIVVAEALLEGLCKKIGVHGVERRLKGRELEGWEYDPPFDVYKEWGELRLARAGTPADTVRAAWRVVLAPFVTLDSGTGIVHIAPAFGEDDHDVFRKELARLSPSASSGAGEPFEALKLFCAVKPDGTFVGEVERPDGTMKAVLERYAGRWVKDCDKEIQHDLKDKGLLLHAEQYRHDYPFCWRADSDPLIQYARPAWYIKTTARIQGAIANNQEVHWLPEHIKNGRFGDFLANNVDWALSRERWWGTPLNVWICDKDADHKEAPASVAEIESHNPRAFEHFHVARRADPSLSEHLAVHKPWIDQVTFACKHAGCGGTMRRVPEVIDCWFDSGCMPFAQWGYPHAPGSKEQFERSFPADFISEAIDQTRGWFYSLLMISSLVFDAPYPHPFKTCIVLGHVSDKEGKKESKSKGNYTLPEIVLDKVAMEFAVWPRGDRIKVADDDATAFIAQEDFDGMDLGDHVKGARVRLYRADAPSNAIDVTLRPYSGAMRRRVIVLHPDHCQALGLVPTSNTVLPTEVPRLPPEQRVVVEDPESPAPGADAFRWFFYASSPPWSATRHSLANVRALQKEFAVKLRNVYSFFTIYGSIDGFHPYPRHELPREKRPELDRWVRSELAITVRDVTAALDAYDVFGAAQKLVALVDSLSNWWVRRSRSRFWKAGWDEDKRGAYETLYECLVTIAKITAPFTPYASEVMWRNLVWGPAAAPSQASVAAAAPYGDASVSGSFSGAVPESVHLADWPDFVEADIDEPLSKKIATVRALVSLGLQVRTQAKIKVRQPLSTARIITAALGDFGESETRQIAEELNVEEVRFVPMGEAEQFVAVRLKPNFRSLGQKGLGKQAQVLKKTMAALASAESALLAARILADESASLDGVALERNDVEVEFVAREGFAAAGDRAGVVVLDTRIDDALRDKGLVREIVNRVQTVRKEMGLEYTDRIRLSVVGSARVSRVVESASELLAAEVLAVAVLTEGMLGAVEREVDLDGEGVKIAVARA